MSNSSEDSENEAERKIYKLFEKANALKKMDDENLSFSQMQRICNIPSKSLADWAKKSPRIMQSANLSSPRLPGRDR